MERPAKIVSSPKKARTSPLEEYDTTTSIVSDPVMEDLPPKISGLGSLYGPDPNPGPIFNPFDVKKFKGYAQPAPKERLEQAVIYLADEDYFRRPNFQHELDDIEAYVEFLEVAKHTEDRVLLKRVRQSIEVHRHWIKNKEVKPIDFHFARFNHHNRLIHLIKDNRMRQLVEDIKAPKIPLDIISGPALHKNIDEEQKQKGEKAEIKRYGILTTSPFFHTKQMDRIRRRLDSLAHSKKMKDAPANFNDPYISRLEDRHIIKAKWTALEDVVKKIEKTRTHTARPFLDKIWEIMMDGYKEKKTSEQVTQADINLLLVLTETSWHSYGNNPPKILDLSNRFADSFMFFAKTVENLLEMAGADEVGIPNPVNLGQIMQEANRAAEREMKKYRFFRDDALLYIKSMAEVEGVL